MPVPSILDVYKRQAVNVKGEENRRVEPLPLRALQEMVNPSSVNAGTRNAVDEEVYRLYEATGGKTMFPQVSPYKIEREGVDVPLTGAERAQFQTTQGRSYYSIIGEMLDSEDYRGMEPEQQVKYFELVNQYAKAVAMEEADVYKRQMMDRHMRRLSSLPNVT